MIDAETVQRLGTVAAFLGTLDQGTRAPLDAPRRRESNARGAQRGTVSDRGAALRQVDPSRESNPRNIGRSLDLAARQVPQDRRFDQGDFMSDRFRFALAVILAMMVGSFLFHLLVA
jgi:hypothetical protein